LALAEVEGASTAPKRETSIEGGGVAEIILETAERSRGDEERSIGSKVMGACFFAASFFSWPLSRSPAQDRSSSTSSYRREDRNWRERYYKSSAQKKEALIGAPRKRGNRGRK
jgi:hypothetical protein